LLLAFFYTCFVIIKHRVHNNIVNFCFLFTFLFFLFWSFFQIPSAFACCSWSLTTSFWNFSRCSLSAYTPSLHEIYTILRPPKIMNSFFKKWAIWNNPVEWSAEDRTRDFTGSPIVLLKTIDGHTMLIIYHSRSLECEVTSKLDFLSSLGKSCGPTEVFSVFNFFGKIN